MRNFLKFMIFLVFSEVVYSQDIGENCKLNDGSPGQCIMFENCPNARKELREGIMPKICSFRGRDPVICCKTLERQTGSVSVRQCENYARILTVNSRANVQHVIGGIKSNPQEFRYMAALGFGDQNDIKWNCGGTLISDQYVLTAAHCTSSKQLGIVRWVRLGDLDLSITTDNARPQDFKVANIIRHPDFNGSVKYNDIALIMLDRKAEFNSYVIPACLHNAPSVDVAKLTAIGWGTLEFNGVKSSALMKVDLDVFTEEDCKTNYDPGRVIPTGINFKTQICAGGKTDEKDTCEGDSGGPLLLRMSSPRGMHQVVGITSFGKPCGMVNVPGIYTRVSHFLPWIERIVWP